MWSRSSPRADAAAAGALLWAWVFAGALATLAFAFEAPGGAGEGWSPPEGAVRARVLYVIDGDTVGASVGGRAVRLRYAGIDAPELGEAPEPWALEAKAANERLVLGEEVWLLAAEEPEDVYGRRLVYVFTRSGVFVNAHLVEHGFASALTIPPNVRYAALFKALEEAARSAGRGMWAEPAS